MEMTCSVIRKETFFTIILQVIKTQSVHIIEIFYACVWICQWFMW